MKKIISIALTLIICLGTISAFAYENGDVIGYACYTDIVAKINGYELESYNVDGYTYIIAQDLRNYGYEVIWNETEREVYIKRYPYFVETAANYKRPFVPQSIVGQKSYDLMYTDIETYVNGNLVPSYNINGRTIIRFDSLAEYGGVIWAPEQKTVYIYRGNLPGYTPDPNEYAAKKNFMARANSAKINEGYLKNSAAMHSGLYYATYNVYTEWSSIVDDMYEYLGTIMPVDEYEQLKADQQLWVEKRDAAMEAERAAKGDTAALAVGNLYASDRCYYLTSLIDADVQM